MRAKGFVLLCCLLALALTAVLVLASLQLSRLASRLNQLALDQHSPVVLLQGPLLRGPQQIRCQPDGQIWPEGWRACRLQTGQQVATGQAQVGFVLAFTHINLPQGGGL